MKQKSFSLTARACYVGYITQAIVNNYIPLLFLTFEQQYGLSLDTIALLISCNFATQLAVDLLSIRLMEKISCRTAIVGAHILAGTGLILLGVLPQLMANKFAALLIAVIVCAVGGGLLEVLVSPIIEACPFERKASAMSLLHSFYCWGSVLVILLSTGFFAWFGVAAWPYMACIWAIIPLANAVVFTQAPLAPLQSEGTGMPLRALLRDKRVWLLALLMLCAGAAELCVSQWASAFTESGLHVSKATGDLLGPCLFAVIMGIARVLYARFSDRLPLKKSIFGSSLLCCLSYLLISLSPWPWLSLAGCALCGFSCGILWPGTISLAARYFPESGTSLFALLALFGDCGCAAGPALIGIAASAAGGSLQSGLLCGILFPVLLLLGILPLLRKKTVK